MGSRKYAFLKFSFSEKATKNCAISPYGFAIYLLNVKTIRRTAQIFVAFSEKQDRKFKRIIDLFLLTEPSRALQP